MTPAKINCTIEMSQPKECSIPENDLTPRSDPDFYVKLHLRLRTYIGFELTSTCHYEHATFYQSTVYPFIRWWYPEILYQPDAWHFLIDQMTDGVDRISRDPRNAGVAILPMEVWLSLDEFKEDTTEPMCVICFENIYPNFLATRTLCNHLFHLSCLDEWLNESETCPICRADLSMPDYPFEDPAY